MASTSPPTAPAFPPLDAGLVSALVGGSHPRPHDWLGQHPLGDGFVIRAVRPLASAVSAIRADGTEVPLSHLDQGLWQGYTAGPGQAYDLRASYEDGPDWLAGDPYRFVPSVGEMDLYLWGEGRHEQIWQVLGAHVKAHEDVLGTSFSVWAPHARSVRVLGDFNGWYGVQHAMRRLDDNGVWELFVPGLEGESTYKFEILTRAGHWVTRADPMARYAEVPPATASKVFLSRHEWADDAWMTQRSQRDPHNSAMSIYEMHLGSWRPGLGYRELADQLIEYLEDLAFTHVEFLPVAEHPFGGSWGYQVTGYYAPTSRFGNPDDFKYLVDRLHQAGIGVIVDWVPAHFPKDEWALARFDGEPLYEHSDPRLGEQPDWGTLVFNFGDSHVRNFLVANALYWLEEFHIDGLRVDAVASMLYLDYSRREGEWVPNERGGRENLKAISFLQEANATAYKRNPGTIMIAEESTSWGGVTHPTRDGGLGFGLKWNMGWMHDSLDYMHEDPMWRSYHQNRLTFSFMYAFSENFLLPISHDEVVHGKGSLLGKMPGDQWQKLANVRAYLAFMWSHPGKQLLFMGSEFGQPSEWSEERGLDWWILDQPVHQGLHRLVAQLNRVYREYPALWERDNDASGFGWITSDPGSNVLGFLRRSASGDPLVCLFNFGGNPVGPYRVGLPVAGVWRELVNTDAGEYGGSGVGNFGTVTATDDPWHDLPASAELTLPPLGAIWLVPDTTPAVEQSAVEQPAVEQPVVEPVETPPATTAAGGPSTAPVG